jgi:phage baseplate assembly protein W
MADIIGSGLSFPLRVDAHGGLALSHRDQDVEEAIGVIVGTAPGERPMRPEFGCGIHDYVFETIDARAIGRIEHEVRLALQRWEPRIEVLDVSVDTSFSERGELLIEILYSLQATNDVRNLVYPFYVIPAEENA